MAEGGGPVLLVPGLLQPPRGVEEAFDACPRLTRFLLDSRRRAGPADLESALNRLFDCHGQVLSLAALRHAGESPGPDDGWVAFADPVHLRVDPQRAILFGPRLLQLSEAESRQLQADLNDHLGEVGLRLSLAASGQWYLRGEPAAELSAHALGDAVGRNAEPFLPGGPGGAYWRRLLNEVQMLLHDHPVNRQREAEGRPRVSGIWPWAGGRLPERIDTELKALVSDDPALRQLARRVGLGEQPAGAATLWVDLSLERAAEAGDTPAWQQALVRLDRHWAGFAAAGRRLRLWPANGSEYRRGRWRPWPRRWPGLKQWAGSNGP